MAAGAYRACAFDQGDVRCWGLWNKIWTGSGPAPSGTAIASLGLQRTVEVTVGGEQICVRSAVGVVECWGLVAGDGSSVEKEAPVVVAGLGGVRSLSAGTRQVCALMNDTTVRCWGDDPPEQSGDPMVWITGGLDGPPSTVTVLSP